MAGHPSITNFDWLEPPPVAIRGPIPSRLVTRAAPHRLQRLGQPTTEQTLLYGETTQWLTRWTLFDKLESGLGRLRRDAAMAL
ncbi:MAG: hypothetical protein R3D34_15000 [Nitratireductor sp.]